MESTLFQEWVKEEKEEAIKNNTRKNTFEVLEARFDFVSAGIREELENINDLTVLTQLHRKAVTVNNIEEFKRLLNKAIHM